MNVRLFRRIQKMLLSRPERAHIYIWQRRADEDDRVTPECGTIGCIAGWAELLSRLDNQGKRNTPANIRSLRLSTRVIGNATKALGITHDQASCLFLPANWPTELTEALARTRPQTHKHAEVICNAIDRFISDPDEFGTIRYPL